MQRRNKYTLTLMAFLMLLAVGCSKNSSSNVSPDGVPSSSGTQDPGPSPMRRLTRIEYNNTIRDLLGDSSNQANAFSPENRINGYDNNADALTVTATNASEFLEGAEAIAKRAIETRLNKILPCSPTSSGEDVCARMFIEQFGKRAYRRPLETAEADRLFALYQFGKKSAQSGEIPFNLGLELTLQAILQSPYFLYRVEYAPADPSAIYPITGYEMASRLSYFLWNSMPDDGLFKAAEEGNLSSQDQILAQAKRMLQDPKAKDAIGNELFQWLQIFKIDFAQKSPSKFPQFTPQIIALMKSEAKYLIDDIFEHSGTAADLLTAPYAYMNKDLASYYGLSGPSGSQFEKVQLDSKKQTGLLRGVVMAALAADITSPTQRGKQVSIRMLCREVPPPPPGLDIRIPPVLNNQTNRERIEAILQNPSCASCHQVMDPIGFGFEHFNAIGLWQDVDPNAPSKAIDSTGEITDIENSGTFDGAAELSSRIASSKEYSECLTKQIYQFGLGRSLLSSDEAIIKTISAESASMGYNIKSLLISLVKSDAFRFRKGE